MKRFICVIAAVGLTAGLLGVATGAETLKMRPGEWEVTVKMDSPMTGQQTTTQKQCVEEDEFDPQSMMQGQDGCELLKQDLSNNTLNFEMQCDTEGAKSTVKGEMTIRDDTGTGSMQMSMMIAGQSFDMDMEFESRRLGDC